MPKTDIEIVADVVNYVGNDSYSNWYAGVAADPKVRLFNDHNVDENHGRWIYSQAINDQHSRSAESMLNNKDFDGDSGGGDQTTVWVYAYKKTSTTKQ